MSKTKKEIVLTAPARDSSRVRPRLRLMKIVEGGDTSSYLVPIPGLATPGLKASFHPSGEVHWTSRSHATFGRANMSTFQSAIEDGTFDRVASSLILRPRRRHSSEGLILPREVVLAVAQAPGTVELELDSLIRSIQPVSLGDTRHLGRSLDKLRQAGVLKTADFMLGPDFGPGGSLTFINVWGSEHIDLPPIPVDRNLPMWRTINVATGHLREYGGIFIRFPEGRRLSRIATSFGLGSFAAGFSQVERELESTGLKSELATRVKEIEDGFVPSLRSIVPRPRIRATSL